MVKTTVKAKLVQYMAGCSAGLTLLSTGVIYAWINPVLRNLLSKNSPVPMTSFQASWIACLPDLGSLFTTIPGGFLADFMGRKTLLLCTTPMTMVAWLMIFYTSNVYVLMAARIIQGFAVGFTSTVFPLYLSEIAEPSVRGSLGNIFMLAFSLGQVYVFAIGPYVAYSTLAAMGTIPTWLFLMTFIWFPESPYFLLMTGKYEKGKTALHSFRGGEAQEEEFDRIRSYIESERARGDTWKTAIKTRVGRKALLITNVISTAIYLGGYTVILSYSTEIFYKTVQVDMPTHVFTLIMGVLIVFAAILCSVMLDLWGRRPVMMVSQFGNSVCLMFAAIYFILKLSGVRVAYLGLATVIAIIAASVLSLFGVCAIKVYQAELFSTAARGFGTAVNTLICGVSSAIALLLYIPLDEMGVVYINFIIFSLSSLFGAIVIYTEAPETRGHTLENIQEILKHSIR